MDTVTFTDFIKSTSADVSSVSSITFAMILVSLIITLILGGLIAFTYKKAFVGVLYQKSYAISLIMTSLVTCIVITVISGNLVLSLGMVGALSIVRFRAAIKEPIDIVYMFWAVGVGISCGIGAYLIASVGSIFISIVMLSLTQMPKETYNKLVIVKGPLVSLKDVQSKFDKMTKKINIRSLATHGDTFELAVEVRDKGSIQKIIKQIDIISKDIEIRAISYANN
jgi:uncharacterized membrane protein YhiD involved in acid resistance